MNHSLKTLLAGTLPALAITALAAAPDPTTQPATQPSTQPTPILAQSNQPLVIPDGTSISNPGPATIYRHPNIDGFGGGIRGIRN